MKRSPAPLVVLLALLAAACPGTPPPVAPVKKAEPPTALAEEKVVWRVSKSGLGFRLSDADPERPSRAKSAPASPLTGADADRLMARLPPFKVAAEKKAFALREKSMAPPRPGETVKTDFPPRGAPPPATPNAKGPVEVTRFQPEGEVSMAPSLSVTFSEPMVELTSHDNLAKKGVPVRLVPEPPGRWRWVGTQTLVFDPSDERLPMATEYQVEVPAGTRSANGQAFAQAKSWRFATPTVDVQSFSPRPWGEPSELEPMMFATFDQRIDRNAVLAAFTLRAGQASFPVRLAHEDEIERSQDARSARDRAKKDRFIALKPLSPLPKNTQLHAVFKAGTPSAEGKRLTAKDQSFNFRTFGPLKAERISCGWDEHCPPLAAWSVRFTNPLDPKTFDKRLISVAPNLPEMRVEQSGSDIVIRGRSKGRTKYQVTVGPELGDQFGQTLGSAATLEIQVDSAEPYLFAEQDEMVVLDPGFGPKLGVFSINRPRLKVRLYAVTPSEFESYQKWRRDWDWEGKLGTPPGRLISNRTVEVKGVADDLTETSVDLSPALKNGVGQVLAIVEPPTHPPPDRWGHRSRQWVRVWLQVTKIGLTAFTDSDSGHVFATRLADGTPLPGVDVTVEPRGSRQKTGTDGLATLALVNEGAQLVGRQADDLVWLGGGSFVAQPISDRVRWFVFDDRNLYKPGSGSTPRASCGLPEPARAVT